MIRLFDRPGVVMAELLGVISAGIGIAAFALQIASSIHALRDISASQPPEVTQDLGLLAGRLQIVYEELQILQPSENLPGVNGMVSHCHDRYCPIKLQLDKLSDKFSSQVAGRGSRWKRLKLVRWREVKDQIKEIESRINDIIHVLNLYDYLIILPRALRFLTCLARLHLKVLQLRLEQYESPSKPKTQGMRLFGYRLHRIKKLCT